MVRRTRIVYVKPCVNSFVTIPCTNCLNFVALIRVPYLIKIYFFSILISFCLSAGLWRCPQMSVGFIFNFPFDTFASRVLHNGYSQHGGKNYTTSFHLLISVLKNTYLVVNYIFKVKAAGPAALWFIFSLNIITRLTKINMCCACVRVGHGTRAAL